MGNMDEMMKEIDEILNGGNEKASIKMNEIVRKARGKLEGEVNEGGCTIVAAANPAALMIIITETLYSVQRASGHSVDEQLEILAAFVKARKSNGD